MEISENGSRNIFEFLCDEAQLTKRTGSNWNIER